MELYRRSGDDLEQLSEKEAQEIVAYGWPYSLVNGRLVIMSEEEKTAREAEEANYVPPRRRIPKSLVVARLIAANKIGAAFQALMADPGAFARWHAPDQPEVYADDPDALALLKAIGADPAVVMAE